MFAAVDHVACMQPWPARPKIAACINNYSIYNYRRESRVVQYAATADARRPVKCFKPESVKPRRVAVGQITVIIMQ